MRNEWIFSGEIFYLKELTGEFAASLKIRGTAKRQDAMSSQITELSVLVGSRIYEEMTAKGIKIYTQATLAGHMETWADEKKSKTMFVVDEIIE